MAAIPAGTSCDMACAALSPCPHSMIFYTQCLVISLVFRCRCPGVIKGREFVPYLFTAAQRKSLEDFVAQNGYLLKKRAAAVQISDPVQFLKSSFPDLVETAHAAVQQSLIERSVAAALEAVTQAPWTDVADGPLQMLTADDIEGILQSSKQVRQQWSPPESTSCVPREGALQVAQSCLIDSSVLDKLWAGFQDQAKASAAAAIHGAPSTGLVQAAVLGGDEEMSIVTSTSSVGPTKVKGKGKGKGKSSMDASKEGGKRDRKKGGKKGKRRGAISDSDDDDDESEEEVPTKSKGGRKGKGSKRKPKAPGRKGQTQDSMPTAASQPSRSQALLSDGALTSTIVAAFNGPEQFEECPEEVTSAVVDMLRDPVQAEFKRVRTQGCRGAAGEAGCRMLVSQLTKQILGSFLLST